MVTAMTSTAFAGTESYAAQSHDDDHPVPTAAGSGNDFRFIYKLRTRNTSTGQSTFGDAITVVAGDEYSYYYGYAHWQGVFASFTIPDDDPGNSIDYSVAPLYWETYRESEPGSGVYDWYTCYLYPPPSN